jgi:hypothetical protein
LIRSFANTARSLEKFFGKFECLQVIHQNELLISGDQSLVSTYRLLVSGNRSLVSSYQSLVSRSQRLVVTFFQRPFPSGKRGFPAANGDFLKIAGVGPVFILSPKEASPQRARRLKIA